MTSPICPGLSTGISATGLPSDCGRFHHPVQNRTILTRHALLPGDRLPSSRFLATILGDSRLTVQTAYGELEAEGLISGAHGSGTYVTSDRDPKFASMRQVTGM